MQLSRLNSLPSFFFFAALLLTIASCEALKPATSPNRGDRRADDRRNEDLDPIQSRRVYDEETGEYVLVQNAPTEPMDTVEWTTTPEAEAPPITDDTENVYVPPASPVTGAPPATQIGTGNNGSRRLSSYNVEVALPFLTNRYSGSEYEIDDNSQWSLHFYSGAKMAMDELRAAGKLPAPVYVNVEDTQADATATRNLTTGANFASAQMVIGPYVKGNVSAMAEAVRDREAVLVSPFSAGTGVSDGNPNYVQVNPTLNTHLRNIVRHAVERQNADRIVLVTSGSAAEKARLATMQAEYQLLNNDPNVSPLEELTVDMNDQETSLADLLTGRKTVFIVPVYEDESFVGSFLRILYTETREDFGSNVAVYGLPQWMDFTRINFDYYEGTNVHVSSSVFIDLLDPAVRNFRRDFYDRHRTLPRDEAYVGYDITRYFLRMIGQYGTRFQYDLPGNPETLLHTKFRFEPVSATPTGTLAVENAPIDRFENMYVNILRFRDFTFRRVN